MPFHETIYAYKEGESVLRTFTDWSELRRGKERDYSLWIYDPSDEPEKQWGHWRSLKGWSDCEFDEAPTEFKAMLLLMGVAFT